MLAIRQKLGQTRLFNSLSESELVALETSVEVISVEAGHVFVYEGDVGDALYLIDSGSVQVFTFSQEGQERVLAKLSQGQYFGEQALLPGRPGRRNASVRAFSDTSVLKITKAAFQKALSKDNPLREKLESQAQEQARQKLAQLSHLFGSLKFDQTDLTQSQELKAGEIVFHQGDPGKDFYVIMTGSVGVYQEHEGALTLKVKLGAGQCFGELALIGQKPRQATVIASEACELLRIDGQYFLDLYQETPELREYIETLQRVYVLPGRGFATQHAGHFNGDPSITTMYHLSSGRRLVASRVIGKEIYNLSLADLGEADPTLFKYVDAQSGDERELAVLGKNLVGLTVWGQWDELGDVHRMLLEEAPIEAWQLAVFSQRGSLKLETPAHFFEESEILCACVQVRQGALQAAMLKGCTSAEALTQETGAGSVCGGCLPRLKELVGRPDWTPVICQERLPLTAQIGSFRLTPVNGEIKPALPGQHIVVQARIEDNWVERPYTLSAANSAENYYEITVKREEQGLFSNWLFDHPLDQGILRVSSPQGHYFLDPNEKRPVICLVAGIGMTPALAILRHELNHDQPRRLHVDYSCSLPEQMIYRSDFEQAAATSDLISFRARMTAQEGRLEKSELEALLNELPEAIFFLCGPEGYQTATKALLQSLNVAAERIQIEEFTPQGNRPVRKPSHTPGLATEPGQKACPHAAAKHPPAILAGPCPGADGIPDIVVGENSSLVDEAKAYLLRFYHEKGVPQAFASRWEEVSAEIERTGSYWQTYDELAYGAKLAWRNSARCIGRLYWQGLQVRDMRHITDPDQMFEALCEHIQLASNGGNLRAVMTVFAPQVPGQPAPRLWNPQLLRYAGYRQPDGQWLGDPANGDLTNAILALGWEPGERTHFDILPLVIALPHQAPRFYPIPPELVLEVPIAHPELPWFADLGLRWYALPAVSEMLFDCGGLQYTCAPFNGWYMGTEIGARNFSDPFRYNMLPAIAERMGLDMRRERSLWRDRALVELNRAVLDSFEKNGVKMTDHHAASSDFLEFVEQELAAGRRLDGRWSWLVPPMSGSLSDLYHIEFEEVTIKPNYLYQNKPYLKV
ncbi:MAG: nitric oxide synthase oxygenase [Candidatus Sericytochromatia bacterium]|nr:nitric oxide synthase oxygenase [Candidatus Sericytochromatia bacterium]